MPKPTSRQLSYLKALANQRGVTFAYPKNSAEASQEINRLKRLGAEPSADRRRERKEIADAIQTGPLNAAAHVRAEEVSGYGAQARWAHVREPKQNIGATQRNCATPSGVGDRIELGSYTTNGERRVLVGQRVDGVVRVSDCPDRTPGRSYLVERGLASKAELDALVADYLTQARTLGTVPITVVPIETPA